MKERKCPSCKGKIRIFYDDEPGDMVICDDCEREYEICSVEPIRLEPIGKDYMFDDYYDDYDDNNIYGYA